MSSIGRIATDPPDRVMIRGQPFSPDRIREILAPYLTEERRRRIREVISGRTRTVVTVVDGISNYGNVSAVMRTAEALGFFEVHVVTRDQPYKHSRRTSQGAEKWLDVGVWDRPAACVAELRRRGYRLVVADSGPEGLPLAEVGFLTKTAVVLGNEMEGVSADFRAAADSTCRIDMTGFVESYNISVAAALMLYHAHAMHVRGAARDGDLSAAERNMLEAHYFLKSVQHAERVVLEHARRSGELD